MAFVKNIFGPSPPKIGLKNITLELLDGGLQEFVVECSKSQSVPNDIIYKKSPHMLLLFQVTTMLGQQLSKEEVEEFMKEADVDGNGKLDYDEFVKMMLQQ